MTPEHWASLSKHEKRDLAAHLEALLMRRAKLHPDEEAFCKELLELQQRVGALGGQ